MRASIPGSNITPEATTGLQTWMRISTAMTGISRSGDTGSMPSRTSGSNPRNSSTWETGFW